jgi:hypothetical protein
MPAPFNLAQFHSFDRELGKDRFRIILHRARNDLRASLGRFGHVDILEARDPLFLVQCKRTEPFTASDESTLAEAVVEAVARHAGPDEHFDIRTSEITQIVDRADDDDLILAGGRESVGDPHEIDISLPAGTMTVNFRSGLGRVLSLAWYPQLLDGGLRQIQNVEFAHLGLHWPDLDLFVSFDEIMAGWRRPVN